MTTPVNEPNKSEIRSLVDSALMLPDFFASIISLHRPINNDIASAVNNDTFLSTLEIHNRRVNIRVNIHTINNDIV